MGRGQLALLGAALALLPTLALLSVQFAQADSLIEEIDTTYLGLAFINSVEMPRSDTRIERGIDAGAKMDRFPLYWNHIETQPGLFSWEGADRALHANEAHGLDTLVVLLGTASHYYPASVPPPTATVEPPVGGLPQASVFDAVADRQRCTDGMRPPQGLNEPIFQDGTDVPAPPKAVNPDNPWARFVHEAANHYRPGGSAGLNVRYWEIWNEPDLCMFWTGTPREYARLLKVAYLVIKQVDPEATVLWGGLAHYESNDFLHGLVSTLKNDPLAEEHNGFFDAAASHHYSDVTKGQHYTQRIRDALTGTGWENKPVWITESGVPACGDGIGPPCPDPHRADAEGQAAFIWQHIAFARLAGGGPVFHFQLHDDCGNEQRSAPPADAFGLVTNEPGSNCVPHQSQPRLAYTAYRLAAQYFPGTELLWEDTEGETVRRVAFYHPESGERRLLVWATGTSPAVARMPATGTRARRIALDGTYEDLEPSNGVYELQLPGSTNPQQPDSATYIGGKPYLLIERDTIPPVTTLSLEMVSETEFDLRWYASDEW